MYLFVSANIVIKRYLDILKVKNLFILILVHKVESKKGFLTTDPQKETFQVAKTDGILLIQTVKAA